MITKGFVFADPGRCIGCKTCMVACLHAHDANGESVGPRLQLVTTLRVSAPVSCHHCLDAPCVRSCPTGCLYADDARVGVREEKCIGCQNCVIACPFGAVSIGSKPKVELLGDIPFGSGTKPVVIKCDLCVGRSGGPACVAACPTEGLHLADGDFVSAETARKREQSVRGADQYLNQLSNASMS